MTDRHPVEQNGLPFVAKCAAVLPTLWLALFLLALPFPGGHPSLPSLVAMVPASLSLTGRAAGWLMGEPGTSSVSLAVLVLATLVELGSGQVDGRAGRRSCVPRQPAIPSPYGTSVVEESVPFLTFREPGEQVSPWIVGRHEQFLPMKNLWIIGVGVQGAGRSTTCPTHGGKSRPKPGRWTSPLDSCTADAPRRIQTCQFQIV